jgi:hypothetical protein
MKISISTVSTAAALCAHSGGGAENVTEIRRVRTKCCMIRHRPGLTQFEIGRLVVILLCHWPMNSPSPLLSGRRCELRPVTSPSLLPPRSPQADILLAERIHTGGPTAEDEFARLFRDKVFVMSLARTSLLSGRSPRGLRDQRLVVIADEAARFHVGLDPKPSNQRLVLVQALAAFMFVLVFHGLFCSLRFFENS